LEFDVSELIDTEPLGVLKIAQAVWHKQ
jgi:hypothetical protein